MREITDHQVGELNKDVQVLCLDNPGDGGACNRYEVRWGDIDTTSTGIVFRFQEGPIREAGINGLSVEALIVIIIDHLRGFQTGNYRCEENAIALASMEEALRWLQTRTRNRISRGVEGTHAV